MLSPAVYLMSKHELLHADSTRILPLDLYPGNILISSNITVLLNLFAPLEFARR